MITYKIINTVNGSIIFRDNPPAWIPMDEANTDYAAFLKYQAEGGKVYAADETLPEGAAE